MITFSCLICHKSFARDKPSKYCSRACFYAVRTTGSTVACSGCATPVYLEVNRATLGHKNSFCSLVCHNKHQGAGKVSVDCKTCGTSFLVSPSAIGRGRKYCGIPCRNACPDFKRDCWLKNNLDLQKKNPTRLEIAGRKILTDLNREFAEQVLIGGKFTVDATLAGGSVVVQWDGDYWHGYRAPGDNRPLSDRQQKRVNFDRSQDAYMRAMGCIVLRFWEHEVGKTPGAVRASILAVMVGLES